MPVLPIRGVPCYRIRQIPMQRHRIKIHRHRGILRIRMLHRMPMDNRETVPKNCPVMVLKVLKMMVKVDQAVRQVPVKMPAVGMVAAKVKTVTKLEVDGTPVVKTDWNEKVRRTAQNKSGFRRIMGKMAI